MYYSNIGTCALPPIYPFGSASKEKRFRVLSDRFARSASPIESASLFDWVVIIECESAKLPFQLFQLTVSTTCGTMSWCTTAIPYYPPPLAEL